MKCVNCHSEATYTQNVRIRDRIEPRGGKIRVYVEGHWLCITCGTRFRSEQVIQRRNPFIQERQS